MTTQRIAPFHRVDRHRFTYETNVPPGVAVRVVERSDGGDLACLGWRVAPQDVTAHPAGEQRWVHGSYGGIKHIYSDVSDEFLFSGSIFVLFLAFIDILING